MKKKGVLFEWEGNKGRAGKRASHRQYCRQLSWVRGKCALVSRFLHWILGNNLHRKAGQSSGGGRFMV